jgi:uncharacterized protein (TIGR02145 family)
MKTKTIFILCLLFFTTDCKKDEPTGKVPSCLTQTATNESPTGATLNGTVNPNGLSTTVTFEYGTTTSYGSTLEAAPSPVTGSGNTNVGAAITGLTAETTYHFRVKATNSMGTVYGEDITFVTGGEGQSPSCLTQTVTNESPTGATLNGTVNPNGLSTAVTFEYGTTTSYGSSVTATKSPVTGNGNINVSKYITGLTVETTYHFRVRATNSRGTVYGEDLSFYLPADHTGETGTVEDDDGNVYQTIGIGAQVWMAENLKTTKYNDGTPIPNITDNAAWAAALRTGAYSDYSNTPDSATTYGRLYNWFAVDTTFNGGKNICPTSWHVPTDEEWTTLTEYLGGDSVAGGKLKESGTIHWTAPNTDATNETVFTALPGGMRHSDGAYNDIGSEGYWWSSTRYWSGAGPFWTMSFNSTNFSRVLTRYWLTGYSVRCVSD